MAQVTIKGHLVAYNFSHMEPGTAYWSFTTHGVDNVNSDRIAAIPHTFTADVPDLNVTAAQVAALEAEKARALADYQASVARINDRLAKLQAITHEVA